MRPVLAAQYYCTGTASLPMCTRFIERLLCDYHYPSTELRVLTLTASAVMWDLHGDTRSLIGGW